jgi:hypothetical protein
MRKLAGDTQYIINNKYILIKNKKMNISNVLHMY